TAVNAIGDFERQLAAEARRRGTDGVICGHIHHPTIRDIDGVTYVNIGDFVESCSLVIEREDGALTPLRWNAHERDTVPAARRHCMRRGLPFTTSYHTRFPEYVAARLPVPLAWSYAYLRRFHAPAERMLAPTPSMRQELERRGFGNVALWTRGVDHGLFRP